MKKIIILGLYMLLSTCAQAQWTPVNFPSPMEIKAVAFPDALTGYVGGTGGWLYRTVNGGSSWDSVKVVSGGIANQEIRQLFFLNASEGYLLGGMTKYQGQIFRTTDKGASWSEVTPDSSLNIQSIVFHTPLKGFAGDAYERIWRTTDGGNSWTSYTTPKYLGGGSFLDSPDPSVVYGGGFDGTFNYKGVFFRSSDSGQTFTAINFDQTYTTIDAISFPTINDGYALSFGFQYTNLFRTTDGGFTWDTVQTAIPFTAMRFITADTGFVTAADGDLYMTPDRGVSYSKVYDADTMKNLQTIFFNGKQGYAAGMNGTLVRLGPAPNSVKKVNASVPLRCYPNPAHKAVKIILDRVAGHHLHLHVMNLQGQVLFETHLNDNLEVSIPVENWPSGLYLLRVEDSGQQYHGKLVVQH